MYTTYGAIMTACATTMATVTVAYADAGRSTLEVELGSGGDDMVDADADAVASSSTVVEEATKTAFARTLAGGEELAGASCRVMQRLVKVYAVGLYVDAETLRARLGKWAMFTADEVRGAGGFWNAVCDGGVHKTVRVVVVREVVGVHMGNGFERALVPRVKARGARDGRSARESKGVVKDFCQGFCEVGTMKVGSEALIRIRGARCELVIDGRVLRVVEDQSLGWALCDMYVGEQAVVTSFRDEVVDGLVGMLKRGK